MIIPVRCFTCGTVVGQYHEPFIERTAKGENSKKVLDELGVERYCCRRMIVAHRSLLDDVMPFG
jgi:DNA-directed RNA polymerase subunit N